MNELWCDSDNTPVPRAAQVTEKKNPRQATKWADFSVQNERHVGGRRNEWFSA